MNKWTIISYYTSDTYYEQVAREHIIDSLKKYPEIPSRVLEVPNLGSWDKNTHYKATFIRDCLLDLKSPVVFLDADARIQKYPALFDTIKADIAFHTWTIRVDRTDLLSGTLYVDYSPKMIQFLNEWIMELTKTDIWEQQVLANQVKKWGTRLNIVKLPAEYCKIFDRMKEVKDPVIEHFQKSRLWRASGSLAKDAKPVIRR